jgi:16S rRNA (guanine527-N7)-methyltransferase
MIASDAPRGAAESAMALAGAQNVSRETLERLTVFVRLIEKWQTATNLIAPGTLPDVWQRHVADSAQLVTIFPNARTWLDLGSGAGFPGLVIAFLMPSSGGHVHLVESDVRKAAFLREAIRSTAAPATVHQTRIEAALKDWAIPVDMVTARALAPLPRLLGLIAPLRPLGIRAALPKGRGYVREIDEASQFWEFDLLKHRSRIEPEAVILELTNLRPKPERP